MSTQAEPQQTFIITSFGIAATTWLAAQLNKHPDIFCAHHYTQPPRGAVEADACLETFFQKRGLDGRYLEEVDVARFMAEHCAATDKPFVGNVHAFKIDTLLPRLQADPALADMPVVNLTRHPVTRTESIARHRKKHGDFDPKMKALVAKWWADAEPFFHDLIARYQVDTAKEENRLFLTAAHALFRSFKQDEAAHDNHIRQLSYERITTEPDAMSELVSYLTRGAVGASQSYLEQIYRDNPRLNWNRETPLNAREQYQAWNQWQKAAFEQVYHAIGAERMQEVYGPLGYDFSFLRNPRSERTLS